MSIPPDLPIAEAIKRAGLPTSHRVHWSRSRKAEVVRAVHNNVISWHEASRRYLLSRCEFEQWERETASRMRSIEPRNRIGNGAPPIRTWLPGS